jgi:hypothetical protein
MLAAHVAAGTPVLHNDGPRAESSGRALLAAPAFLAVNLTRQQFVQVTWALKDVTRAGVAARDRTFNNTLAVAGIQDFRRALTVDGWPQAPVVAVRQPCFDTTVNKSRWSQLRACDDRKMRQAVHHEVALQIV